MAAREWWVLPSCVVAESCAHNEDQEDLWKDIGNSREARSNAVKLHVRLWNEKSAKN